MQLKMIYIYQIDKINKLKSFYSSFCCQNIQFGLQNDRIDCLIFELIEKKIFNARYANAFIEQLN